MQSLRIYTYIISYFPNPVKRQITGTKHMPHPMRLIHTRQPNEGTCHPHTGTVPRPGKKHKPDDVLIL